MAGVLMECPKCGLVQDRENSKVAECRIGSHSKSIKRRRVCQCGCKFSTREYTCKDLEELLVLRDILMPKEVADKSGTFISNMIEDLKTALVNARKVENVLNKYRKNRKTPLFGINGGKK